MAKYLPLLFVEFFLFITIFLFVFGPFEWVGIDIIVLTCFIVLYQLSMALGYFLGTKGLSQEPVDFKVDLFFKQALIIGIVLIIPYTYIYTGNYPWAIFKGIPDQAQAFIDYYTRLSEGRSIDRVLIILIRTLFAPLVIAIFPLFFWTKKLTVKWKILFIIYIIFYFSFSLLRGTDKEGADFIILILISWGSKIIAEKRNFFKNIEIGKKLIFIFFAFISMLIFYNGFIDRKMARLGGDTQICIDQANTCANLNNGITPYLSDRNKFGFSIATLYLSIGYYGMGLALEEEFNSTLGFGHSLFISKEVEKKLYFKEIISQSYTEKVSRTGWDPKVYWVTTYTWLANDIGFFGVAVFMFLIGLLLSKSWQDIIYRKNPIAVVLFSQILLMLIYMPAFNIIMQNIDGYFAFIFWLLFWLANFFVKNKYSNCQVKLNEN